MSKLKAFLTFPSGVGITILCAVLMSSGSLHALAEKKPKPRLKCNDFLVSNVNHRYAPLTLPQKREDFRILVRILENNYGPLYYKGVLGLRFDRWKARALQAIEKNHKQKGGDQGFYDTLTFALGELHDAHVYLMRQDPRIVTLGFQTNRVLERDSETGKEVEKAIISHIYRSVLDRERYSLALGDEIVEINGIPVAEYATQISPEVRKSDVPTARDLVFNHISIRSGRFSDVDRLLRESPVQVTIQDREGNRHELTLPWTGMHIGKTLGFPSGTTRRLDRMPLISPYGYLAGLKPENRKMKSANTDPEPDDGFSGEDKDGKRYLSSMPWLFQALPEKRSLQVRDLETNMDSDALVALTRGEKEIFEDVLAKKIGTFDLRLETGGSLRVGLMPLETFDPDEEELEDTFSVYRKAVNYFQEHADALVIDLRGNLGGSGYYLEKIISLLTYQAIKMGTQTIPLTRSWRDTLVQYFYSPYNSLGEEALLRKTLEAFDKALEQNKTHLAGYPIFTDSEVLPFVMKGFKPFDKPLYILVDGTCASAADMFPGLLKVNERAVIIGSNTAGAGGNISQYGPLPNSNLFVGVTESLLLLPDKSFIEDVGVAPHVPIRMSQEDYREGYQNDDGYLDQVLETISRHYLAVHLPANLKVAGDVTSSTIAFLEQHLKEKTETKKRVAQGLSEKKKSKRR